MSLSGLPADLFRAIFEKHPGVKLLIERQSGRIDAASDDACAFYGYPREQLVTMTIFDLNTLPQAEVVARMQAVAQGRESRLVFSHRRAAGDERVVEVHSGPVGEDGKHLLSIIHDITDASIVREELDRFFALAPEPLCIVDEGGSIVRANPALAELVDRRGESLAGCDIFEFVHPDERDASRALIARHATTSTTVMDFEARMLSRESQVRVVSWSGIWDGKRRVICAAGRDVTERRAAEAERERLVAELQHALNQVKRLHELLPICSACKRVRDDAGYWAQIDDYLAEAEIARFSHGICPECLVRLYPEDGPEILAEQEQERGPKDET